MVPAGDVVKLDSKSILWSWVIALVLKRKEKNLIRDPARSSTNSRKPTLLLGESFWIKVRVGFPVWVGVLVFVWGENVSELGVRRMKTAGHA